MGGILSKRSNSDRSSASAEIVSFSLNELRRYEEDYSSNENEEKPVKPPIGVSLWERYFRYLYLGQKYGALHLLPIDVINHIVTNCLSSFFFSDILTNPQRDQITSWITNEPTEWKLIYSGKRDGFKNEDFYDYATGKGNLVIVYKVKEYIFGGFTPIVWTGCCSETYNKDPCSIIFTLVNPCDIPPTMFPCCGNQNIPTLRYSILDHRFAGANFGSNNDITIKYDEFHQKPVISFFFNNAAAYRDTVGRGCETFTGSISGNIVDELEAFQVSSINSNKKVNFIDHYAKYTKENKL